MPCPQLPLALAMFFSIGQTTATSEQVAAGLGKHLAALSAADYVKFQKAGYAASLLYIAALACAKLSALALLLALSPLASHRKPIIVVAGAVLIWGFCALIATTFQCNVPRAWAYETGKCFNQVSRDALFILEFQRQCSPCREGGCDDLLHSLPDFGKLSVSGER
jgi:hypothetical protein